MSALIFDWLNLQDALGVLMRWSTHTQVARKTLKFAELIHRFCGQVYSRRHFNFHMAREPIKGDVKLGQCSHGEVHGPCCRERETTTLQRSISSEAMY